MNIILGTSNCFLRNNKNLNILIQFNQGKVSFIVDVSTNKASFFVHFIDTCINIAFLQFLKIFLSKPCTAIIQGGFVFNQNLSFFKIWKHHRKCSIKGLAGYKFAWITWNFQMKNFDRFKPSKVNAVFQFKFKV